jgi:elongation factor P
VKVIASSLRKGNIVDIDGKLYVVAFAESIHPGKGTPVTQIDMRRISDGVKVSRTASISFSIATTTAFIS